MRVQIRDMPVERKKGNITHVEDESVVQTECARRSFRMTPFNWLYTEGIGINLRRKEVELYYVSLEFTLRYFSRCEKRQSWVRRRGLRRRLGRSAYEPQIQCGTVVGVVRCGLEPAEQNVKSREYAERNVLVDELLWLRQAFNSRHQTNVSAGS